MRAMRARRAHTSKLVTTNVDAVSVTSMPASWPEASNMWRSTKRTNRVSIGVRVLATSRVDATKQEASREGPSALRESPKVHETALLPSRLFSQRTVASCVSRLL
jgi:hypothetical protein